MEMIKIITELINLDKVNFFYKFLDDSNYHKVIKD